MSTPADTSISLGTFQPQEQPAEYGWDNTRGAFAVRTWEAIGKRGKKNIDAMGASFRAQQIDHTIRQSHGKSVLVATFGYDPSVPVVNEAPLIRWEVRTNRVPKDIYQIGKVLKYQDSSAYPITVVDGLNNALLVLKECVRLNNLTPGVDAGIPVNGEIPGYEDWLEAYALLTGGTTEQIVEQSVIVRTATTSARYARTTLLSNVGTIFTAAQMQSLESCPNTIVEDVALPAGLTPFDPADPGFGFLFGYRKGKPEMVSQSFNKWSVTTQWEEGIWAMFLYDPAS